MKVLFETYFVETHEYNDDTMDMDLAEYFAYESGVYDRVYGDSIEIRIHHTILSLAVF
jgi:hypothetical protein